MNVLAWKAGGRTNKMLSLLLALWGGNKKLNRCKEETTLNLDHHHEQPQPKAQQPDPVLLSQHRAIKI